MTAPKRIREFAIRWDENTVLPTYETEDGDFVCLSPTTASQFIQDVTQILQILQYPDYTPLDLRVEDVELLYAVSIENDDDDIYLYSTGITRNTPYAFPIYVLRAP